MHVVVQFTRAAAGLPGREVAVAECLCGWAAVCGVEDAADLDRDVADHLTFHGAA